jgi:hypothetical protein
LLRFEEKKMSQERIILQEREAVNRLRAELHELFVRSFGKEPNPEVIKEEAENIVSKHGAAAELKDILNV